MAKSTIKASDRGRNTPEPGPTPGTRALQRDTATQLDEGRSGGDPATSWEREEQDNLPPRGTGSIHNQGEDHGPTVAEVHDITPGRSADARDIGPEPGLHSGGTRGPSNENRESIPAAGNRPTRS
jgi:hypothetical protein